MRDLTDGHVVVDSMVALMILALAIILGLQAVQQAGRVARLAQEVRRANALLNDLMLDGPRSLQAVAGTTDDFSWSIETQITGAERPIEVCRRLATLVNRTSSRRYSASSLETCPTGAGA